MRYCFITQGNRNNNKKKLRILKKQKLSQCCQIVIRHSVHILIRTYKDRVDCTAINKFNNTLNSSTKLFKSKSRIGVPVYHCTIELLSGLRTLNSL